MQNILQEITVAVSWNQLEAALKAFFGLFEFETEEERRGDKCSGKTGEKS